MIRIIASCSLKSHTSKVSPEKVLESYFLCTFSFSALSASTAYERSAVCIREKSK